MKTLAIFVVLLAITVAMQLKESPPIQSVDPRLTERWGFMGLQPNQSPPSQVGARGLGGFQLPNNASMPVRRSSLRSRSGKSYKPVFFTISHFLSSLIGHFFSIFNVF